MNVEKLKFINSYDPSKGGSFQINEEINELYHNDEGLTVDDFKDKRNNYYDKLSQEEYICGFPVVYQITDRRNLPSIFKNGFDREFTGSKAGNMYGPGVYSTYRLSSSNDNVKKGIYGDTFIKMLVLSKFKDFLIYDKTVALRTYGKDGWRIESQLMKFFGSEECAKMRKSGVWRLITSDMIGRTAEYAYNVWRNFGDEYLIKHGVAGFIFLGGHDGYVSVIRDFKNVLPIAYSVDFGKTWRNDLFTQDTVDTIFYNVDGRTFYGKDVDKYTNTKDNKSALNRRINDFIMVQKGNKYNFLDVNHNELSPYIDFDAASPIRNNGMSYVVINDPKFVEVTGEPFEGYVSKFGVHDDEDIEDFTPWDEFNAFIIENGINDKAGR